MIDYGLLIDAVRMRGEIFDKRHPGFKNPAIKEAAWKSVSSTVNVTVPSCKSAWKTLRERFCKDGWKLMEMDCRSGAGDSKRKWAYYDAMEFLKSHIRLRRSTHNLPSTAKSAEMDESQSYSALAEHEYESFDGEMLIEMLDNSASESSVAAGVATTSSQQASSSSGLGASLPYLGTSGRKIFFTSDSTAEMFKEALSSIIQAPPESPLPDPDDLIAQNVKYCLKSLKNTVDLKFYRRKFRELIAECEDLILEENHNTDSYRENNVK